MNKRNTLINFLEIGRLDRGLFRIWILCAVIYYIFFYFNLFTSTEFNNYKVASKIGHCTTSKLFPKMELPKETFVISKVTDAGDGIRIVEMKEYGSIDHYTYGKIANGIIVVGIDVFKDETACKSFINGPIKEFYFIFVIMTLIPIIIILIWFLFKKTFIWIYKGFKK